MVEAYRQKNSPFDLSNHAAYEQWCERKLHGYPARAEDLIVEISDPKQPRMAELGMILSRCCKVNMAIYAAPSDTGSDRDMLKFIGEEFGLTGLDCNMGADDEGVTTLKVMEGEWRGDYIPYTNRPIHWHTDGYYNSPDQQINALMLHCVSPAARGGENALLDHEIAYMHLRDTNPDYIRALMAPDAMTIPANIQDGKEIRPARSGPVFSVLESGALHMRYTARTRSIEWAEDALTREAVQALEEFLESDSPYIFRLTLQAGQGLICNNVLHNRSGFDDDEEQTRCLYRLRYYERIANS